MVQNVAVFFWKWSIISHRKCILTVMRFPGWPTSPPDSNTTQRVGSPHPDMLWGCAWDVKPLALGGSAVTSAEKYWDWMRINACERTWEVTRKDSSHLSIHRIPLVKNQHPREANVKLCTLDRREFRFSLSNYLMSCHTLPIMKPEQELSSYSLYLTFWETYRQFLSTLKVSLPQTK